MKLPTLLLACSAAATAAEIDYESMLSGLWEQTDTDGDGKLQLAEMKAALKKLDVSEASFTSHGQSATNFFNDMDTDSDGGLTTSELAGVVDYSEYKDIFIKAFTNGAGEIPTEIPMPSSAMLNSKAKATTEIVVQGTVGDIYPGTRLEIKQWIADLCGVGADSVTLTVLPASDVATPVRRKLQANDEVVITGTAYLGSEEEAEAALALMPTDASDFAAIPAFDGLAVSAVSSTARLPIQLPTQTVIIVGLILLVAGIGVCGLAQTVASKKAKVAGAKGGCCQTGCCSFFAVKPWAFGEFCGCAAIAGTVFYLYTNMNGLTNVIVGLVELLVSLVDPSMPAFLGSMTSALPTDLINLIQGQLDILKLLPVAVMVPGIFAILFLLLASLFPLSKKRKGSYCCTKCMIFFGNIFLVLSLIFYSIFAGIAVILKFGGPQIDAIINQVTGMCDTIPSMIQQLLADNQETLNKLNDAGQDTSELQTTLDDVAVIGNLAVEGCGLITSLLDEAVALFLPGFLCIVAIVFAIYNNNSLCCAAGCCCKGPPKAAGIALKSSEPIQNV